MQEYPKWKYKQGDARIVENAEEEAALKGAWYDSPADVPAPKSKASAPSEQDDS